jgi:formiminotetrahydrofolate cyclodeaminase
VKKIVERAPNFSEAKGDFASLVARAKPLPGGGSVAAYAGSLAAALGEMMAGLTEERKKFAAQGLRVREIHQELTKAREALRDLVQEDSAAYQSILDAMKLPKGAGEEIAARAEAIERATRCATETPLRTARAAFEVLDRLRVLVEIGNPNARTDVAVGALLAFASLKGAQYNILSNIPAIKDKAFAESCRTEAADLVRKAQEIVQQIDFKIQDS